MSAPTVATARNTVANPTSRPAPSATRGVSAETIEAATGPARVGMWRLALVSQRNMPKAHSDSESANMLAASHVGRREFVIFSTATIVRPLSTLAQARAAGWWTPRGRGWTLHSTRGSTLGMTSFHPPWVDDGHYDHDPHNTHDVDRPGPGTRDVLLWAAQLTRVCRRRLRLD